MKYVMGALGLLALIGAIVFHFEDKKLNEEFEEAKRDGEMLRDELQNIVVRLRVRRNEGTENLENNSGNNDKN